MTYNVKIYFTLYLNAQIFIQLVKPIMNSVNNKLLQKKRVVENTVFISRMEWVLAK